MTFTTILAVIGACFLIALFGLIVGAFVVIAIPEIRHRKRPPGQEVIKKWEAYKLPDHLVISGMVSRHEGRVVIDIYDGEGESRRYLGTATGTVYKPRHFYAVTNGVRMSDSLSFEYSFHGDS